MGPCGCLVYKKSIINKFFWSTECVCIQSVLGTLKPAWTHSTIGDEPRKKDQGACPTDKKRKRSFLDTHAFLAATMTTNKHRIIRTRKFHISLHSLICPFDTCRLPWQLTLIRSTCTHYQIKKRRAKRLFQLHFHHVLILLVTTLNRSCFGSGVIRLLQSNCSHTRHTVLVAIPFSE